VFGEQQARALFGLTNVLVMFGGSKDGAFNKEISDLVGQTRVSRSTWQAGTTAGRTFSGRTLRSSARRDPTAAGTAGPW
jgi:type IV secretion system protein VirD4